MALNASTFNRQKLATTLQESLTFSAAIADDATNGQFVVNIYTTVTLDATGTATKLVARVKLPVLIEGTEFKISPTVLMFPGSAADYTAGITTPADSTATKTVALGKTAGNDLDSFLTAAGDARKNS